MINFYPNQTDSYLPPVSEKELSDNQVLEEISQLKYDLGKDLLILGHHYQQDDIISFADITGDSLQLAQYASKEQTAKNIVFCGVHFMAETADMLTSIDQKVFLPDLNAGCSMADMANLKEVETCWNFLSKNSLKKIIPVTYINCSADLKSFVGKHGGAICTSSNAHTIISWALNQNAKLLFFPDQHLGRNTCYKLNVPLEKMCTYDPRKLNGGLRPEQVNQSDVILWYGYCSVHQGFKKEHIDLVKKNEPHATVIVHPECNFEVVQAADLNGSTSFIVKTIENSLSGSIFAVGTEINLVQRIAKIHKDKKIFSLSPYQCLCTTMYRVRPRWLLATLRGIKNKNPINQIKVSEDVKKYSLLALQKMLELS